MQQSGCGNSFISPKSNTSLYGYFPRRERCNILLFGLSGSGKSSIINTLSSNFDELSRRANVRSSDLGQCTVSYNRYKFNDKVSIYDTWGWGLTTKSYTSMSFKSILRGVMKENHQLHSDLLFAGDSPENDRIIDAVVFVLSSDVKNNPRALVKMKRFYELAKGQHIPCFFAVTKLDLWFASDMKENLLIATDPRRVSEVVRRDPKFMNLVHYIQENIKDSRAIVLPIINYDHVSVVTNDVINIIAQQFVTVLTRKIDVHYEELAKLWQQPNAYSASEYLFKNEEYKTLIFDKRSDPNISRVKFVEIDSKLVEANFVIMDCFFNQLLLGRLKWRYFMVTMKNPNCKFVGLYSPDKDVYFETCTVPDTVTVNLMKKSFGEKFAPPYQFLELDGGPHEEFHESMVKFVKIGLMGGFIVLKRQARKDWTRFHSMMLNVVQGRKERQEIQKTHNNRIDSIKNNAAKSFKGCREEVKKMKGTIMKLKNGNQ